ncbi:MAG: ribosome biogenesis GTPase Der [Ignavibacteria bacterium]|jgi:GTP-binding protein|nr:ribosome biogenesis GTPase Der [Ignavibacteria bacterium]MCU7502215.1 ribosome biogenesis GTPase Der [Ignavibacteria bacterium]MCU7517432.1 ribosome biogenesis GTPase Der [Ignavibacteria bacterium]
MKDPIVVIVGRPNVGKSTFFNRLTGSSEAIVDDLSGVTRDRKYGEVDWSGKIFRLIDTGGYVPDSPDLFETAIREQVEIAITEADLVLFVVDAKQGLSPMDSIIARMLRESNKKTILIVNKVDSQADEPNAGEFYSLGFDDLFDISAMAGRKIGDLLDEIIARLDFSSSTKGEDTRLRIAMVGKPNVGKSSLTNALLGYDRSIVTNIPGTTRDSLDSYLKYYGEEIILVDTAGLRRKSKIKENIEFYSMVRTMKALGECDIAVVMLDSTNGLEGQDQKIIDEALIRRKGVIIAVNKWDLIEKDSNTAKHYEEQIRSKMGSIDFIPITFISALTKQRIYNLIELCKKVNEERKKKIPTSRLNDVMLEEIKNFPPPSTPTGKEIKIKYITQVGDSYPAFLFFTNEPKYVPDNYKRYLEKALRRNFGFEGVPVVLAFKAK